MGQYRYDFSIVMAVYNVEDYLREAVESLVHQTIGFDHIQLILVDDGSTDGSGKICDEYKKKYPSNIVVIHKENEGVSTARNAGLPLVLGKYISFLDSDDTLDANAMSKVRLFMDQHETVDLCCIPIIFFGEWEGPHILNDKFADGSRVADLTREEDCIILSASSAFYRADKTKGILFDTRLRFAEDAKRNLQILMENPRIGIVADTKYNYRKRGNSALDGSVKNPYWYLPYQQFFVKWALDTAEEKWGIVPKWIQNAIMYDQQWRIRQPKIPHGVLSKKESAEYLAILYDVISRIDDDIIIRQKNIAIEDKVFILTKKYSMKPDVRMRKEPCSERLVKTNIKKHNCFVGIPELLFGKATAVDISDMITVLDFLTIDKEKKTCTVEGYHRICGVNNLRIQPYLLVNGKIITCTTVDRRNKNRFVLGEAAGQAIGFKATFSLNNGYRQIIPILLIGHTLVLRRKLWFGSFFPVSETYKNGYALINDYWISVKDGIIKISKKPFLPVRILREGRLLIEIWNKNYLGGRKAVCGRLFYHLTMPFKRKSLWIISDRIMRADDNGEALFRYLQSHCPPNTNIVFALSKKSPDYARLSAIGKCVDSMSFKHKLLHLLCDVNISAHAEGVVINPFEGHHEALRDLLTHQRFVFLQHGVTKDDLSEWLNRYNKNMSGFITSASAEQVSIQNGNYKYTPETIWLTGFPRFDLLYHDEKKRITIMPSWRKYLMGSIDSRTGTWEIGKNWKNSLYFRFYNELLNSEILLRKIEEYGYTLQFFPHPNLQPFMDSFDHNSRVIYLPQTTSYRDIYAQSDLVVTDYSSAVFDFAYLRKPIVYCQFDKEEFFSGEHVYTQGYFDYERDGFGEVAYSLEETIQLIINYVSTGCLLKEKYRKRIDDFFAYNDQDNCKRVVEKILALSREDKQ